MNKFQKLFLVAIITISSVAISYHLVSAASISVIAGTDTLSASRTTINDNFTNLNSGKLDATSGGSSVVGIGTSTPWGKLSVQLPNASTSPVFVAATTTLTNSGSSTALLVDSNGRVGIGTSTITHQLSIAGSMYLAGDGRGTTTTLRGLFEQLTLPGASKATSTFASGLSASGLHSIDGLTVVSNSTNTFSGGLTVLGAGGLATANGLTITAGSLFQTNTASNTLSGGLLTRDLRITTDGLTIAGGSLVSTVSATNTFAGGITAATAASMGGLETNKGLTISGGNLLINSESFADLTGSGLSISNAGALTCNTASASVFGCLASADWTTFNNKADGTINTGTVNRLTYYSAGTALSSFNQVYIETDADAERVGIGTTSPYGRLSVQAPNGFTRPLFLVASTTATTFATNTAFFIDANGNGGFASTSGFFAGALSTKYKFMVEGAATVVERPITAAATVGVDWTKSNQQTITMTAATTFVFLNPYPGLTGRLVVCQDTTGSRTAVWPASTTIQWSGSDVPPSLTIRPGHCDIISVLYTNATGTPQYFMVKNGRF